MKCPKCWVVEVGDSMSACPECSEKQKAKLIRDASVGSSSSTDEEEPKPSDSIGRVPMSASTQIAGQSRIRKGRVIRKSQEQS